MATPRKHWFKVPDSIGDEDWDNDLLATLVRLQARMNTRWARNGLSADEASTILLTAGDAMTVTRRRSFARALQVLRRCSEAVTCTLLEERASVKFCWPKWPDFQGMASRELPESRPRASRESPPPQDAPARRKTQDAEEPPVVPQGGPEPALKARGRVLSEPPDALSEAELGALVSWTCEAEPSQAHRVEALVQECLDHFRGEGKKKHDWVATCRNWIRRDRQYREQRSNGGRGNGVRPGPIAQAVRNIAARDRARRERANADAEQALLDVPARRE